MIRAFFPLKRSSPVQFPPYALFPILLSFQFASFGTRLANLNVSDHISYYILESWKSPSLCRSRSNRRVLTVDVTDEIRRLTSSKVDFDCCEWGIKLARRRYSYMWDLHITLITLPRVDTKVSWGYANLEASGNPSNLIIMIVICLNLPL